MLFRIRRGFVLLLALGACRSPTGDDPATILAALERCVEERALARDRLQPFRAARPADAPRDPVELTRVANRWLATLGTSHTEFRTLREPRAFELVDVFWDALDEHERVHANGGRRLGYVHVWSWAGEEVQATLRELLLEGPLAATEGLVLDLRDGIGGANPEAFALFSRELPTLTWSAPDGSSGTFASSWTKPVVLLIDEHTTSGKEIFARAFQRAGRGKIVGARSAGAVVGGSLFLLPGPSVLYLAVRDILVDGERLEGRGVTPDELVPWERESGGPDLQLERALELLRAELARS